LQTCFFVSWFVFSSPWFDAPEIFFRARKKRRGSPFFHSVRFLQRERREKEKENQTIHVSIDPQEMKAIFSD